MSTVHGGQGRIITDGLVLRLDAANPRSYTNVSTRWSDLSGNDNNGTLTNGPTYNSANGGSIVFDGTNQFINCGNNSIINTAVNTCTINVWFKQTSSVAQYRCLTNKGVSDADENFSLAVHHVNQKFYFDVGGSGPYIDTPYSYSLNVWYNICVTHNRVGGSSTLRLYVNGINIPSTTISPTFTPVTNSSNFTVGTGRNNALPFPGNISLASLYNRALSATEVLQNYNATRARFGI